MLASTHLKPNPQTSLPQTVFGFFSVFGYIFHLRVFFFILSLSLSCLPASALSVYFVPFFYFSASRLSLSVSRDTLISHCLLAIHACNLPPSGLLFPHLRYCGCFIFFWTCSSHLVLSSVGFCPLVSNASSCRPLVVCLFLFFFGSLSLSLSLYRFAVFRVVPLQEYQQFCPINRPRLLTTNQMDTNFAQRLKSTPKNRK